MAQLADVVCKVLVSVYARSVHANEVDQTPGQEAGPALHYRGVAAYMNTKKLPSERARESFQVCEKRLGPLVRHLRTTARRKACRVEKRRTLAFTSGFRSIVTLTSPKRATNGAFFTRTIDALFVSREVDEI